MSISIQPGVSLPSVAEASVPPVKSWLVSPLFDLLFVANVLWWPLAVVLSMQGIPSVIGPLTLFQIYFLSTPHRWITLVMVFFDSERFWKEPARFGSIGLSLIAGALALVWIASLSPQATNSLMLLMMIDYAWNAWHFAAQHAGIARIYGRFTRPDMTECHVVFERTALRLLVLWAFFRQAISVSNQNEVFQNIQGMLPGLNWLDPLLVAPALIVIARECRDFQLSSRGRLAYLVSVVSLYVGQLLAIRMDDQALVQSLFLGTAIFHSTEYLAVVNWSVQKRTTGIWKYQLSRTGLGLVVFMVVLGVTNLAINTASAYAWALMTLLVSFLHYAYDGMIWKSKPRTTTA
ncbi:MAG: hypothetical protein WCJ09_23435 [Planctomycetota bacterium]